MAHTRCMPDKQGYMHARVCTHRRARIHACTRAHNYNIYCFSMATVIRENSSITLYVNCLSCSGLYLIIFKIIFSSKYRTLRFFFLFRYLQVNLYVLIFGVNKNCNCHRRIGSSGNVWKLQTVLRCCPVRIFIRA